MEDPRTSDNPPADDGEHSATPHQHAPASSPHQHAHAHHLNHHAYAKREGLMDNAFMMFLGAVVLGYFGFYLPSGPPVNAQGQFVPLWAIDMWSLRCTSLGMGLCGIAMLTNARVGELLYIFVALASAIAFIVTLALDQLDHANTVMNWLLDVLIVLINGYGGLETLIDLLRARKRRNLMDGEG